MGLFAPLFLIGALAVAIPILVHLVHRERKEPLAFPSLMFLRRVPFRSAKRQRIRYWLLFLMRAVALLLIAAAFARPWLPVQQSAALSRNGGKDRVVLVDRSYSMAARDVWERAQRAAADEVAKAGAGDRVAVIAFGEQAQVLARLDEPRARAQMAIAGLEPSSDVTRYAPAFRLAATALSRSQGPAEIVVITDRQRIGWRSVEQAVVPRNTTVRVVDVRSPSTNNVAVTGVTLSSAAFAGRQRVTPRAQLLNRSAQDVAVGVQLRMEGRVQQERSLTVPANGAAAIQFDPLFADAQAGEVRVVSRDDLAADDAAYFTTNERGAPSVRIVANGDAAFYFESAIAAGGEDAARIQRTAEPSDVVAYLDAALPTGTALTRLEDFVRNGGGLIVASAQLGSHEMLPLQRARPAERGATALVAFDGTHPIFSAFRATGDAPFSAARIARYARGEASADATVVARFDDGAPAILERRIGRGRVLVVATSFSRNAGNLVLQPAFVPFAQQLVRHAAASAAASRTFTVGNVIDVNAFAAADRDAVIITPARERVRLAPGRGARTLRLSEPGIYQIRASARGAQTQLVAANLDVSESDMTPLDASVFQDAISPADDAAASALASTAPKPPREVWWYLLVTAFVLLILDTLVGNRISTAWRT